MLKKRHILFALVLFFQTVGAQAEVPVRGFADIGYRSTEVDSRRQAGYYLGPIDFYYSKVLEENLSFLAEIVFETNDANEAVLDPERLWVQYFISPLLQIKAGREHTALGYWNDLYHHGQSLQVSITRPVVYRFEDDGGILPVHSVGLELRGMAQLGTGDFGYVFDISNGRGPNVDPPQVVNDANGEPGYNLLLYYSISGVRFGAAYYKDRMPGSTTDSAGNTVPLYAKGDETILSGHLVYTNNNVELLSEIFSIQHEFETGTDDRTNKIGAGYGQASYRFDKWTPYVRVEKTKAGSVTDQYLPSIEKDKDTDATTYGLRYDLTDFSALKAERRIQKTGDINTKAFDINWSCSW